MTELEKWQVALFTVIRNSGVMPQGIRLGKSMEDIHKMSYEVALKILQHIDFDRAYKAFMQGKRAYERDIKRDGEK